MHIVKSNGEIIVGSDLSLNPNQYKNYLEKALNRNGWLSKETAHGNSGYIKYTLSHNNGESKIIHIYLKCVVHRGKGRDIDEKAAQMSANMDTRGLQAIGTTGESTYTFGIYRDPLTSGNPDNTDDEYVICAWHADEWGENHGIKAFNYFIRTKLISEGFKEGFARKEAKGGTVVAFRPEFIHYYLTNKDTLHPSTQGKVTISIPARNKIFYGAPGTGKSYYLNYLAKSNFNEDKTKRITFHPSYSYQQFVGSYKPNPIYKTLLHEKEVVYESNKKNIHSDQLEPLIDYAFVPGPFMEILVEALKPENKDDNYLLIIEEINRANVASVFGDVFQLLDRKSDGSSTYEIGFNTDIKNYLKSKNIAEEMISIPKNLHIWATMNNADQGVMPLDTAFKRRWTFRYVGINEFEDDISGVSIWLADKCFAWNEFRHELNNKLKEHVHEDKLIGPFFMNSNELNNSETVKSKLVLYLREDVLRHNPSVLFGNLKTFSDIAELFQDDPKKVFKTLDWENITEVTYQDESVEES